MRNMHKGQEAHEMPYRDAREQKLVFFLVAAGVFVVTYGLLFIIDFLPEKPKAEAQQNVLTDSGELVVSDTPSHNGVSGEADEDSEQLREEEPIDPNPTKIIFDKFDREVNVLNPQSRAITDLDEALLSGVVRHPDSADFEREGTMFLFGHSSYLPHVLNKSYQAFNDIQKLEWGDTVRLQSSGKEYVYRVDRVYQVQASVAEVDIERGAPKLTLATCNSFGTKDDRYIVEATLVEERALN